MDNFVLTPLVRSQALPKIDIIVAPQTRITLRSNHYLIGRPWNATIETNNNKDH